MLVTITYTDYTYAHPGAAGPEVAEDGYSVEQAKETLVRSIAGLADDWLERRRKGETLPDLGPDWPFEFKTEEQ